ncbi:unnamed protein product [Strongylus vulgaris]|uniref:Small ribosomal subunit protein mS29 n=1 Tax=Strongylus vulgaris TaxID=40348 RepID=A0A3P7JJI5_STRVU|nr:unnamed protein product [Strongylus vulgaris]
MYMTACTSPSEFTISDVGRLYEIPREAVDSLGYQRLLPSNMAKQTDTLGELVTVIREPLLEISTCMSVARPSFPALRMVLWGPFGTGKSNQHIWKTLSTLKTERNQHIWKTLSTLKTEQTACIQSYLIEGISAPFLATDCIGGLFRELKRHSSAGSIKVFVAIDDANSLWGKTLVKKADRTFASPSDLTLVNHYRSLISSDWENGCILLVADKKEVSDARDEVTVPRHTPLELFGEEGFYFIEPFLPIEVKQYTMEEISNMYQYYYDKRWLASEKARTEEGKKQLFYLSAFNPYNFERLCAFN